MLLILVIAIVIIIILNNKNQNLKIENDNLRRQQETQNRAFLSFCPKCGENLKQYTIPTPQQNQVSPAPTPNTNPLSIPKKSIKINEQIQTLTKKEQKNNLILITGAILIVLSAIIFLMSTWMSTGNVTKTLVILFMLLIFFTISYISEKVFNLKQTSKVFFYIALTYIPIALISISLFGLFGYYLSIYGSGKYIYFSISCLITSITYIIVKDKYDSIFLKTITELFLFLTTFFASLSITTNEYIIELMIITYTILRQYLAIKQNNITNANKVTFSILTILNIRLILQCTLISLIKGAIPILHTIDLILLLLNIYILLNKILNLSKVYDYIYPILIIFISISFSNIYLLELSYLIKCIIILLAIILLSTYYIIKNKRIKVPTLITTTLTTLVLCKYGIETGNIMSSLILSIYTILSIINYYLTDKDNKPISYILTISIILLSLSVQYDLDLPHSILLLVPEIILITSYLYKNINNTLKESFYIIGLSTMCLEIPYLLFNNINYINIILSFIGSIILMLYFIKDNKEINKNISYIIFTFTLTCLLDYLDFNSNDIVAYGISISTIIITFIETLITRLNTTNSFIYIIVSSIISILLLNIDLDLLKFALITTLDITLIYNNIFHKRDTNIYVLIAISLINSIFFSDILIIDNLNIMIFLDISLIALTTYISYLKKGINQFTIISYIYIICSILFLELNPYINYGMLLVSSYIHYLSNESKHQDFFKLIMYTSTLLITRKLFKDLDLLDMTILNIGPFLIYSILVSRTIVKKYIVDYKFLEYIIISILNIIAIANYTNEVDGMLYVSLLIGLIIIGYISKLGPIFLTSLIFVIINALILTREFWFSIPWWIYVLGVGIILVTFAMRNEANNNESKTKIDKIKKDLDL